MEMEVPLKGNIKDTSLVKLLVFLNRQRKTGILSISTPQFIKKIYLKMGDVIFASSTFEDDRLGEMLIKAGKITIEQYDRSVEVLKASTGKRQGAILVELGYLTAKELFWGVKYQVSEIIQNAFIIEDAEYDFTECDIPMNEVITLRMSTGNLIYSGVNRIDNWTRIRNEMPSTDTVLRLSSDPLSLFQDIDLKPHDKKILSLVDGIRPIKEIINNSWMSQFDAMKTLYVLLSIGMVEPAGSEVISDDETEIKSPPEETISLEDIFCSISDEEEALISKVNDLFSRLETLRPDELLGVDEKTDDLQVKQNYYKLAKEYHPDRYFNCSNQEIKEKLSAIFDSITKAYNTLKDESSREKYFNSYTAIKKEDLKADEGIRALEQFKNGVIEFKKGNFWGAVDNFKWATKLMPDNASYWSYLSLAYSKMPGRLKDSEEALLTAIKLEPYNADFQANLGLIYLKAGLKKRAQSAFQKALNIDPNNEKARKGIEQSRQ